MLRTPAGAGLPPSKAGLPPSTRWRSQQGGQSRAGRRARAGWRGGHPLGTAETAPRSTTRGYHGSSGLKFHCRTTLRQKHPNGAGRGVYKCKHQQVYKRKYRSACAYRYVKRCIYIRKRGAAAGHAGAGGQGGTTDTASSRPGGSGATRIAGAHGGQHSGGGRAPLHPCTCGHGCCTPFTPGHYRFFGRLSNSVPVKLSSSIASLVGSISSCDIHPSSLQSFQISYNHTPYESYLV